MLEMDPPEQLHFSFKTSTLWYDIKTIKELIERHFRAYGRVKSLWFARILLNSTFTSGYGFVSYETAEEALGAVQGLRQSLLDGIAYDCKFSKAFTESSGLLSLPAHAETSPVVWVAPMPAYPTFCPTFLPAFPQLPLFPTPLAFPQCYPPTHPNALTQPTPSAYPQVSAAIPPLTPQPQPSPLPLYSINDFPPGGHYLAQTPYY